MNHQVLLATREDAWRISGILRVEDIAEVLAASGKHPREVMPLCIDENSSVWIANGRYAALYGVNSISNEVGIPWMVATDAIEQHPLFFLRNCRAVVNRWLQQWPILTNCVDARNDLHIKWLKWCGFQFIELIPEWGAAKLPFWRFEKKRV